MTEGSHWNTALQVLAHPYRRQLLVALLAHNPQDDDDTNPMNVSRMADEPEVLEAELVHNHLPKLEDEGFIDWDRERREIHTGPKWDQIAPIVELIHGHRDELPDGWL